MLERSYRLDCMLVARSMFHIWDLQKMMDSPFILKPLLPQLNNNNHYLSVPRPRKGSISDAVGYSVTLADAELTTAVAQDYLRNADHDFECVCAAARFMDDIWAEYRDFSNHIWKNCIRADIARFMARKTGRGCIGDTMSIDPYIMWNNLGIGQAFVETRGANDLVKEFFCGHERYIYNQFSDGFWAGGTDKSIESIYAPMIKELKDVCQDFLEKQLPIREYAVYRFFPEVREDPLRYTEDSYPALRNVALKLVS